MSAKTPQRLNHSESKIINQAKIPMSSLLETGLLVLKVNGKD